MAAPPGRVEATVTRLVAAKCCHLLSGGNCFYGVRKLPAQLTSPLHGHRIPLFQWEVIMRTRICAIALALFGIVSPASAEIVTLTYTGTVVDAGTGQLDNSGLFGPAGSSLVGDAYTAVYVFDTTKGGSVF